MLWILIPVAFAAGAAITWWLTRADIRDAGYIAGLTDGATVGERHIVSADTFGAGGDVFNEIVTEMIDKHRETILAKRGQS